jgi:hypothetical protein
LGLTDAGSGIRVEYTWIVETLHSVFFQDRQNALKAMLTLTEDAANEKPRALLRERAMEPLMEMARWRHLPHALPAYLLLGRALGKADDEIQKEWVSGEREAVLQAIAKERKKETEQRKK